MASPEHPNPEQHSHRQVLIEKIRAKLTGARSVENEPIAVVGMNCRFPGTANSLDAYWGLLRDGVDAITEVPPDRWNVDAFYDPNPAVPGKMPCRWGGFLDKIDEFDAAFFGIAPREANQMDPQQRLILEVTWGALENAGIVPTTLSGSSTGVFVGASLIDYGVLQLFDPYAINTYSITGMILSVLSNRLSYFLDVRGPSVTIDTACSSSLVAVHQACQNLRSRQCDLAIAGGVNAVLIPGFTLGMSKLNALSPDGRCKAFDASANGFVRGEGCGVIILKRLSDAIAANDPIIAVIRGSAVHSEGRSNGLTAPSAPAQEALLRQALAGAGVEPSHVSYIEAHGTGTPLGDPIEVEALAPVYGAPRHDGLPCLLGSVKSNFGHLESAAGIAGLIKVALCLRNRAVVPTVHFRSLNPNISFDGTRLGIAASYQSWPPVDVPFFAGVSSFGIGGTIAHVILEEPPQASRRRSREGAAAQPLKTEAHLLPLSARDPAALRALAAAFQDSLSQGSLAAEKLSSVCFSAAVRRAHHDHRIAVVGETPQAIMERLGAFIRGESRSGVIHGQCEPDEARRLVFVFAGHGSQWVGMARSLMETAPAFRETIERCDGAMQREVGWRLCAELMCDEAASRLDEVDVVQPVIFAMQVALAAQWRAFGVQPAAVVGHSLGEIAAAHVAGILTFDDAVRVICARGRLVKKHASESGGLLAAEMTPEQAESVISNYKGKIVVGVVNSPTAIAFSGPERAISELQETLHSAGIFCRRVRIRFASHSPAMQPTADAIRRELRDLHLKQPGVPFFSTVTGRFEHGATLDADYWARNVAEPVRFASAIQVLGKEGYSGFLEIGGHPVLLQPINDNLAHVGVSGVAVASLVRGQGERLRLMESLAELYCSGCPIDFQRLHSESMPQFVSLPPYPFQRKQYWLPKGVAVRRPSADWDASTHPMLRLGTRFSSSLEDGQRFWELVLDMEGLAYGRDHRIRKMAILPATAYLELAVAAAKEAKGAGASQVEEVVISEALVLPEAGPRTVQVAVWDEEFRVSTPSDESSRWVVHCRGRIRSVESAEAGRWHEGVEEIQRRCGEEVSKEEHYEQARMRGIEYGPMFQGLERVWRGEGEALGRLCWPEGLGQVEGYAAHPAMVDACLQLMLTLVARGMDTASGRAAWLPVRVGKYRIWEPLQKGKGLWGYARGAGAASGQGGDKEYAGDVVILDEVGNVLVEARGIVLRQMEEGAEQRVEEWMYTIGWQEQSEAEGVKREISGTWLIGMDGSGVGSWLVQALRESGARCVLIRSGKELVQEGEEEFTLDPARAEDWVGLKRRLEQQGQEPLRAVVHLWGLDARVGGEAAAEAVERIVEELCTSAVSVVQAFGGEAEGVRPRLWLVTQGGQRVCPGEDVEASQAALWGLGRTIGTEHPELVCTRVDLGAGEAREKAQALLGVLREEWKEDEIALRQGRRLLPRLVRQTVGATESERGATTEARAGRDSFRLDIGNPGSLDSLSLRACVSGKPGAGQVQIAVRAAGLNFRDVLKALGEYPDVPKGAIALGDECAGVVTAVGRGVDGVKVGDEVLAVLVEHALGSIVTVGAERVVLKPAGLSMAEAATIPTVFLTAWYALHDQGRLAAGERVLIHAAAGGVGQAALQIAREAGAEVYATAGSEEKREYLRSQGVEHVFDSRTLEFVRGVREATGGAGVDVVLNSLAGEYVTASLSLLRPFGRFVELGKKDVYSNTRLGLEPFKRNLSFTMVDLELLGRERPERLTQMLGEVMNGFAEGRLRPICRHIFPMTRAEEAFRWMAQAKHIGKIALVLEEEERVQVGVEAADGVGFRADGTYLITGGLGGLGLRVAQWMAEHGARHLVLMGRREPGESARQVVAAVAERGVEVRVVAGDVSVLQDVQGVMDEIDGSMPPLRGIVHAAGVLADGMLQQMQREQFGVALAPKVKGAWNLHCVSRGRALEHFVLFSSLAGVLGTSGQGNYAAANAFLDGLAWHRRAQGLAALSIDWGSWSEVGMAAEQTTRGERLAAMGLASLSPAQGLQALGRVLGQSDGQVIAARIDLQRWRSSVAGGASSLLSGVVVSEEPSSAAGGTMGMRMQILSAAPGSRAALLTAHLKSLLAKVLQVPHEQVRTDLPFRSMGMDSLTALEFRNRLEATLAIRLSTAVVWSHPTVSKLVPHIAERLGAPLTAVETSKSAIAPAKPTSTTDLEQLSQKELVAYLDEKLTQIDTPKARKS